MTHINNSSNESRSGDQGHLGLFKEVCLALGMPASCTASELEVKLRSCPLGSAAVQLWDELPSYFSSLQDQAALNDTLEDAFERCSKGVNQAFADALTKDAVRRNLLTHDGKLPSPCESDAFGEQLCFYELLFADPQADPYSEDLIRELQDGWGLQPAEDDDLIALRLTRAATEKKVAEILSKMIGRRVSDVSIPLTMDDARLLVEVTRARN